MPINVCGWQSLARALPAPCRFQAAPIWTPAAICQDTGCPGCWPRRPGAALMSLFLFAKVYYIFLIRKKIARNFQEIFDFVDTQLVTKGNFSGLPGQKSGFSGVKRFNDIILYISICDRGGVRARYRAGYQIKPYRITGASPHYIKPFYFRRQDSGRHD